jgi:hypothetical protein
MPPTIEPAHASSYVVPREYGWLPENARSAPMKMIGSHPMSTARSYAEVNTDPHARRRPREKSARCSHFHG